MILEEKLVVLRKSLGLSQDDLASKLDVSRQAVYKWETGQAVPEISKLKVLSSLYNVSIDNLLNNNEDIKYVSTAKSSYGMVIRKKVLNENSAENDNTKLLPEDAKKFKTRKLVLGIAKAVNLVFSILAGLFFVLAVISAEGPEFDKNVSNCSTFLIIALITGIVKKILGKTVYPKVQFSRNYFKQEEARVNKELLSKYETVIMLQKDLLAWFVYDRNTNSFGFYFDNEMQFFCPIRNYASMEIVSSFETLTGIEINYFNSEGKLSKYKFSLSHFRSFWKYTEKIKDEEEGNFLIYEHKTITTATMREIKSRLDAEKSRI
jgi:transcriptional regulator with XRE-family HTH domain